ncbi:MAG TPA: hypothetical protein VD886_09985, partial [Herpetosiphonaceae bacterium]|nr:hypothetical protein [Herpetosiphonaceae bacterium]
RSLVRLIGPADQWALPLRARISAQPAHVYRRTVALELAGDRQLAEQLLQLAAAGDGAAGLAVQGAGDPAAPVDLRVVSSGGGMYILDGNYRELLALPRPHPSPAPAIMAALESIARHQRLATLSNQAPSRVSGALRLSLWQVLVDAGGFRAAPLGPGAINPAGEICLPFDERRPESNLYGIELYNQSPVGVYPHVFVLGADYSVSRLYPAFGQEELLEPGHTLAPHRDRFGGGCLEIYLPDGVDFQRDLIKVIATTEPGDFGWLEQDPALGQSPRRAEDWSSASLNGLIGGASGGRGGAGLGGDWGSVELGFGVVRAGGAGD